MATTHRSELVNKIADALTDEAYDGGMGRLSEEQFAQLVRTLAVTAAEVVEKAHTPTDDEREALARLIHNETGEAPEESGFVADAILAAGFRRSEVPEPSEAVAELERQIQKLNSDLGQEIDRREELHDIADRLSWAIAPVSEIGEHSSANDPWENAIEYAEARVWAEPQGEPADAPIRNHGGWDMGLQSKSYPPGEAVDAALAAWNTTGGSDRVAMRAALRAAGGVQ